MNQILYSGKAKKNYKVIIIATALVVVLLFVGLFSFGIANLWNNKILRGVFAANIEVSEMTQEEAAEAIQKAYRETPTRRVDLVYEDRTITLYSDEIGYTYSKADQLAKEAYAYGRSGNIIKDNFTVLKSLFRSEKNIGTIATIHKEDLVNIVNAVLEGDEKFSKEDFYQVSGDKLYVTKGTQGKAIDYDLLAERVIEAFETETRTVTIPMNVVSTASLDMDLVYQKVHQEPRNATYREGEDFAIIKEEDGIDFDLIEAKKQYALLPSGETMEIILTITKPEVTLESLESILFRTTIATATTQYDTANKTVATNLEKAANQCKDIILYPGDEFSYHQVIHTSDNQLASTLYNAVLKADLLVQQRSANKTYESYVKQSLDACVTDGAAFQFKNTRKFPVKMTVTCINGNCTVNLLGYKEANEAKVEIETKIIETKKYETEKQNDNTMKSGTTKVEQKGIDGYVSEAYKVYYNANGEEIDRKLISKDTYAPVNEIVKVGTKVIKSDTSTPSQKPVNEPLPKPEKILPPGWDNPESGY